MEFTALQLLYIVVAALATAVLHSVGGFAGALMLAIALAPVLGVKATVPIVSVAMVVSHASRAWLFRKAVDWGAFRILLFCSFPFIIAGVLLYVDLSEKTVAYFLGGFLLATLPLRRLLAGFKVAVPRAAIGGIAVPYGFLSGMSFGVGMILAPFLLGAGIAGEALVATVAVMGVVLNITKTVAFGLSPLLTPELALIGLAIGLCTIPGHALGRWIVRRTSIRVHTLFLESFIAVGALYMLGKGFYG